MKIALVVHDLNEQGGHSLYTKILADSLSASHHVTVFANRCARPGEAMWEFHPVRAWRANALATVRTFPLGLRPMAALLDGYEIRHMQGYCGGSPNVVTAHICVAAYLSSLRHISLRNRLSLEMMMASESKFYRNYEGQIIAVSQKVAGELREFYQARSAIKVIPHGVDARRFQGSNRERYRAGMRARIGVPEEKTLALYVGDLTKAHTHLKRLAQIATEVQLVIVTPSERYRWNAGNVTFVKPTREIERYYAAADAFVFPSTYDSFGMVVLEAMASRLPVFCSTEAGAAGLIQSGRDGFVLPLDEWVETTREGLRDTALLNSIGAEAEISARQHDWSTVVREVERTYFEVAGTLADAAV